MQLVKQPNRCTGKGVGRCRIRQELASVCQGSKLLYQKEADMFLLQGGRWTAAAIAAGLGLALFAQGGIAQQSSQPPVKVGWLVALTGPNSSPGIGFDRGIKYAVEEINEAGGIKGRKLEVITRDTQGDPTKAVNAALELINNEKVEFTIGPTNSGEGLATTPVIARSKIPSLVFGVMETLMDPQKY